MIYSSHEETTHHCLGFVDGHTDTCSILAAAQCTHTCKQQLSCCACHHPIHGCRSDQHQQHHDHDTWQPGHHAHQSHHHQRLQSSSGHWHQLVIQKQITLKNYMRAVPEPLRGLCYTPCLVHVPNKLLTSWHTS